MAETEEKGKNSGRKNQREKTAEREIVLDVLIERERTHRYSNVLIRKALDEHDTLDRSKKAFIKRLAEGTIEREKELDEIIRKKLRNPDTKIKMTVRCVLRMGIYQILYMDAVPDFAAVNESLELLKKHHLENQTGFVNAILRNVCRDHEGAGRGEKKVYIVSEGRSVTKFRTKTEEEQAAESMPEDILKLWEEDYGKETAGKLSRAMMEIRPVCIRFVPSVSEKDRAACIEKIRALGAEAKRAEWVKDCWYLTKIPAVTKLPGFAEGMYTVQDESSAMTGMAAGLKGSETILDLCAAPGGKSVLLASLAPEGKVYAYDLTKEKTDRIRENAKRLHVENIEIGEQDAANFNPAWEKRADFVLCDVPCSGLGVMTRKRDIKYNVDAARIRSLVRLQRKIVTNAAAYVKPGGALLYSTCTIDLAENDRQAAYITNKTGLVPSDLKKYLPENIPGVKGCSIQLMPHIHGTDGFFMARFEKPKE